MTQSRHPGSQLSDDHYFFQLSSSVIELQLRTALSPPAPPMIFSAATLSLLSTLSRTCWSVIFASPRTVHRTAVARGDIETVIDIGRGVLLYCLTDTPACHFRSHNAASSAPAAPLGWRERARAEAPGEARATLAAVVHGQLTPGAPLGRSERARVEAGEPRTALAGTAHG